MEVKTLRHEYILYLARLARFGGDEKNDSRGCIIE